MDLRVVVARKVQLYLLFYRPTRKDPMQNRLVALMDGPFCHVEMAIPDRFGEEPWERAVWGSSIYQDEPVFFKQKTYKRDGYVAIGVEVTVAQLYRIRSFCRQHAERQTPFSVLAMYAAYLPFQLVETDATFCSKHVTHALQAGGITAVEGLNAALMTPSRLYHRLKRSAILQVVPSRMLSSKPIAFWKEPPSLQQQQQQQQQQQLQQLQQEMMVGHDARAESHVYIASFVRSAA